MQRKIHPLHPSLLHSVCLRRSKCSIRLICFKITRMETLPSSLFQNTKKMHLGEYSSTPSPAVVICHMLPEFSNFENVHQMPTFFLGMVYNHISFPKKALICYISLLRPLHQLMYPVICMFPCFPSLQYVHQLPTFNLGMVKNHISFSGKALV